MKKQIAPPVHRGILTIEVLMALVIIMFAVSIGYPRYTQYIQEMEWGVEANQLTTVSSAAKSYIRDNRNTLINQVSGEIPVTMLPSHIQALAKCCCFW